ncbi:hypothetical protein CEE44_00185 [Candidatus Woesearchaeota archaeon B3_Woes]|nr:MAG: hypothetical protein CEE44_00185 [Candidatus Woesearchaeota archaeon B3_Woes]
MDIKKDVNFLYEIGTLRFVKRTWSQFLTPEFSNVTEHTFRAMWISLVLAKHEKADSSKVLKIALIHDIPETRVGDVNYLSKMFTNRDEKKAINEATKDTSIEEYKELIDEFEKQETIESKIVKDADNLDVDLELAEQYSKGNSLMKDWKDIRLKVRDKLFTETAKKMFDMIQESNPHEWHLTSSNRFTEGDWKD